MIVCRDCVVEAMSFALEFLFPSETNEGFMQNSPMRSTKPLLALASGWFHTMRTQMEGEDYVGNGWMLLWNAAL
jgi:hypothetical protein